MTMQPLKKGRQGLSPKDEATQAQRLASSPLDPVWVGASAGSGKTKVLTDRVLRLLLPRDTSEHGKPTPPDRILSITYTKTAAAEMAERISRVLSGWATMDEVALKAELAQLLGRTADAATVAEARRLFAGVVDAPGGMKIMTIHSFCQSVLKRFPLEAGLSPHFELVDERTASEYLLRAQHECVLEGGADIATVTARFGDQDLAELIRALARRRRLIFALIENTQDVQGDILEKLGLPRGTTRDDVLTRAQDAPPDRAGLLRAAAAMAASNSKKDNERGARIHRWLAGEGSFDDYVRAFIGSSTGEVFSPLAHGGAVKNFSGILGVLEPEARRVRDLAHRLQMADAAAMTAALLRTGSAILARYEDLKARAGQLDYDDLILKTAGLFSGKDDGDWVLFKLDGGIDHILVDEAQDTSPEQWQVIDALTREFFAGAGARDDVLRTLFVVGDEKQSIFSFQGADPEEFKRRYLHFGQWLKSVDLKVSFRSTEAVLSLVDAVFTAEEVKEGVVFDASRVVEHVSARPGHAGLIEVWPVIYPDAKTEVEAWVPPGSPDSVSDARARLAVTIADTIAGWQKNGEMLAARGRLVRPGDILVLVQRRNAFVELLVRALKARGIPVAGVDRMVLTEQIAVMDMMAMASFCLLPQDDLTLATLLKSPLIGLGEERLFDLCHGRRGTLWQAVSKEEPAIAAWLAQWIGEAAVKTPYAFFAGVLARGCPADAISGQRAVFARLGPDSREALEEFLNIALDFERLHPPSLQMFLHWFEKGQSEIKRDQEKGGGDNVRIMTVHASKGLQAPVVFMPDTVFTPRDNAQKRDKIFWPDMGDDDRDPVLWVPPAQEGRAEMIVSIKGRLDRVREREYRRLLYVALTRAADRLYVCGYGNSKNRAPESSWHACVARAFEPMAEKIDFIADGRPVFDKGGSTPQPALRFVTAQETAVEPERADDTSARRQGFEPLPGWVRVAARAETVPPRPLKPSAPVDDDLPVRPPLGADEGRKFARGLLIHRLLQTLPELDPARQEEAAARFLGIAGHGLQPGQQDDIRAEVMAVLRHPDFAPIFGPGSMAEVPVVSLLGADEVLSGQIDRLCVTSSGVLIVDYKTNRPPPFDQKDVAPVYLRQMALYRAAARKIWPGREIKCALLWTDSARLMPLSGNLLDPYDP